MTTLGPTTFVHDAADPPIDMTAWNFTAFQQGQINGGDSGFVVSFGGETYVVSGHDLTYETTEGGDVELTGGTITGITHYPYSSIPPQPLYDYALSDFSLDAQDFSQFVAKNDVAGFERALFSGDDHMDGGTGDDVLFGLTGNDRMAGSSGADQFNGGRGRDTLIGGAGGDFLDGGRDGDVFVYRFASDSGGGVYDRIEGFNANQDLLVVPHAVTGIDGAVDAGYAAGANVDPELAAALDADHLGAHHAALARVFIPLDPMLPAYREAIFLVVDVNGVAGYQGGEDLAIEVGNAKGLNHLDIDNFLSPVG